MSRLKARSRSAREAAGHFGIEIVDDRHDRVRVIANGELDIAAFDTLSDGLRDARRRARCVLLDITRVSFIDSTGMRAIVCAHRAAQDAGRQFALSPAMPAVERTLELSGLATMFEREPPQHEEHAPHADRAREDRLEREPVSPSARPTKRRAGRPQTT